MNTEYQYDPRTGLCMFDDGTVYTVREMVFLSRHDLTIEDREAIHRVKRIFGGELDTSEPEKTDWLSVMGKRLISAKGSRTDSKHVEPVKSVC